MAVFNAVIQNHANVGVDCVGVNVEGDVTILLDGGEVVAEVFERFLFKRR